jgi:hypothetical protein
LGDLGPCPIVLERFEIVWNWEMESALLGTMVIIVPLILGPNCVTIKKLNVWILLGHGGFHIPKMLCG